MDIFDIGVGQCNCRNCRTRREKEKWCCECCGKRTCICICKCCKCTVKECKCRKPCDDSQCNCDIIKSIAMIEVSISHILNAEGEKIQKAVQIADNVNDLLKVNCSVIKTLNYVTQLEQALLAKLISINDTENMC